MKKIRGGALSAALIAVLFSVILLLIVFTAVTYRNTVAVQDENSNTRAVLSYVTTAVKDHFGSEVRIEERNGTDVLVIADGSSSYEQQIWHEDGHLLETYGKRGSVPDAEDAVVIGETETFEMEWLDDGLLGIRTDAGTSYVHVRKQERR